MSIQIDRLERNSLQHEDWTIFLSNEHLLTHLSKQSGKEKSLHISDEIYFHSFRRELRYPRRLVHRYDNAFFIQSSNFIESISLKNISTTVSVYYLTLFTPDYTKGKNRYLPPNSPKRKSLQIIIKETRFIWYLSTQWRENDGI